MALTQLHLTKSKYATHRAHTPVFLPSLCYFPIRSGLSPVAPDSYFPAGKRRHKVELDSRIPSKGLRRLIPRESRRRGNFQVYLIKRCASETRRPARLLQRVDDRNEDRACGSHRGPPADRSPLDSWAEGHDGPTIRSPSATTSYQRYGISVFCLRISAFIFL